MTIKTFDLNTLSKALQSNAQSNQSYPIDMSNDTMKRILLEMGVKPSHVEIAMRRAAQQNEPLATIMRDFSFISGEAVAQALSKQTGIPYFSIEQLNNVDKSKLKHISIPSFLGYNPVDIEGDTLVIAVSDVARVSDATNKFRSGKTKVVIASEHTIQAAYRTFFAKTEEAVDLAIQEFRRTAELSAKDDDSTSSGALRQVYFALIRHACYSGASDIYLDRSEFVGFIKLKINGVGTLFRTLDLDLYQRIMNKLVQENVKADELKKRPREALVKLKEEDAKDYPDIANRYSMRLELSESRGVRSAVIRILDRNSNATDLERLGLDEDTYRKIMKVSKAPTGFFIITGPTGSGKTTTMYAVIKKIDPVERSIQSIENPIEYEHGLWTQFELRKDAQDEGDEYNEWLKALLRNAPDVILIGEVRDKGVARICLNAANTGHLVFASLHTNTAPLAIVRLRDLEVDMNVLASVLLGVLGQRLVRLLCNHCKVEDTSVETQERINIFNKEKKVYRTYKAGDGCPNCDHTGYRGRAMVYELFEMNAETRILLEKNASPTEIALSGLPVEKSMWACGLRLIQQGSTSIEELENRVPYADVEYMLQTRQLRAAQGKKEDEPRATLAARTKDMVDVEVVEESLQIGQKLQVNTATAPAAPRPREEAQGSTKNVQEHQHAVVRKDPPKDVRSDRTPVDNPPKPHNKGEGSKSQHSQQQEVKSNMTELPHEQTLSSEGTSSHDNSVQGESTPKPKQRHWRGGRR
jgi:type II secretory ATPase GspE/PulE/Tfp pilus assembly ATPase PilB-like protein